MGGPGRALSSIYNVSLKITCDNNEYVPLMFILCFKNIIMSLRKRNLWGVHRYGARIIQWSRFRGAVISVGDLIVFALVQLFAASPMIII